MGRILGLDVGEKTIGIAMSDELKWTAQALMTLRREGKKKDFPALLELVAAHDVETVVIGLPKNMNNSLGEQAEKVLKFSRMLEGRLTKSVNVELWDERLTTSAAEKTLLERNVSRKKRKNVIDTLAAVFILQGYLDAHSL
jgi:putative Holliday junction resolvase